MMPSADPLRTGRVVDHLPVPTNELHEFFSEPQRDTCQEALLWEVWFKARGVRYERRNFAGVWFQLYVHRACRQKDEIEDKWCCSQQLEERRAR